MKWHYSAGRKTDEYGYTYWRVYEVYADEEGTMWTERGIEPGGETRLELVDELARMLKDVCYHPAIDADAEEYTEL